MITIDFNNPAVMCVFSFIFIIWIFICYAGGFQAGKYNFLPPDGFFRGFAFITPIVAGIIGIFVLIGNIINLIYKNI